MKKVEMAELRVVEAGAITDYLCLGEKAIDPSIGKLFKYNFSFILPLFGKFVIGFTPEDDLGFGLLLKGKYTDDDGSTTGYYPLFKVRFPLAD